MTTEQFRLPDVGEGLTEAEIVTWHVAVGDTIEVNQVIVDIETAKSVVELPSPYAGTVMDLLVAAGEAVDVGTPIISVETSAGPTTAESGSSTRTSPSDTDDEPKLLVGYGAREPKTGRRRRGTQRAGVASSSTADSPATITEAGERPKPRAKPPVRKLAHVLGVDLAALTPTGPDGVVVRADVLAAAEGRPGNGQSDRAPSTPHDTPAGIADGDVVRYPIKGIRKATAAAMVASAFTAPHVTEFVTIDVTETLKLKERVQRLREFRDIRLTTLAFIARSYLMAIARTPVANGRWDDAAQEIVVPATVNLGIAAATPRGLMVPNIKGAQALGLREIAIAINELATKARAGKTQPAEMAGGTTTITNIGIFGIDTGTPILSPGEAAILAVGTIRKMPWVVETSNGDSIEPCSVLQLALSFDHRVMDGQEGSELLASTAALLTDPGLGML